MDEDQINAIGTNSYGTLAYGGGFNFVPPVIPNLLSIKAAYICGQGSETDSTNVHVTGHEGARSWHPAFIHVSLNTSSLKRGYSRGHIGISRGKPAFVISIIDNPSSSKSAYIAGISKPRVFQPAFIQIQTPLTSSRAAYVHIETPVTLSKGVTIVASSQITSNKGAFIYGATPSTVFQPAFIQIETPMLSSKALFLHGEGKTATKTAFIEGIYKSRVSQLAYLHIETPLRPLKQAFTRGHRQSFAPAKFAYLKGHVVFGGVQPAYVHIITPVAVSHACYIRCPEPSPVTKRSFIRGIESARPFKPVFIFGMYIAPPTAIGAHIVVPEAVQKPLPAFIQIETPALMSKPAFIGGLGPASIAPKMLFIDSRYRATSSQAAYVHIETGVRPFKRAFIQIHTPIEATIKRLYVRSSGDLMQPLNAYIDGANIKFKSVMAYVSQVNTMPLSTQRCFIDYRPDIKSQVMCFIFETGLLVSTKPCYIVGEFMGATTATKQAYIGGFKGGAGIALTLPLYVEGVIPFKTKSVGAFISNGGIILNVPFDDGKIDFGTAVVDDKSGTDNDGYIVNWPTWVEGPFGGNCND